GGDYTEINPATINWLKISMKEFNTYRFRQVPGKLNALGKVKFMFQNPCQIYLHDSIESEIFNVYKRDFSHGCIRLGEPIQLTNYLLNKEQGWSPEKVATILDDEQTKVVMLPEPINIYLTYFTAWVDDNDWVQFRNDIYHLDKLSPYAIYLPPKSEDNSTTD
ncbi:MAG: L,D-transpeptidase family protein, partial [Burkholderiales bacterium]